MGENKGFEEKKQKNKTSFEFYLYLCHVKKQKCPELLNKKTNKNL